MKGSDENATNDKKKKILNGYKIQRGGENWKKQLRIERRNKLQMKVKKQLGNEKEKEFSKEKKTVNEKINLEMKKKKWNKESGN